MMESNVRLPIRQCVRRVPNRRACTPPGFEWIPGYLNQYGGQMTDYGRNWLIAKWEEPYRAALEQAEQEYQDCLRGGVKPPVTQPIGLQLRVATKVDPATGGGTASAAGLASRLNLQFRPTEVTRCPCDPFAPFDPDHASYPIDPNASPVSVPRSVFWIGSSASYDISALIQAMQPLNSPWTSTNPLALRDLELTAERVMQAVRLGANRFLPIPAQVQPADDLRTETAVVALRFEITVEQADDGMVLDAWSVSDTSRAYTDFYWYYFGNCPVTPAPPQFDWNQVPRGCIEDLILRALPSAITTVTIKAGTGETLDAMTLATSNAGTISSRPVMARHRLFNSPAPPHFVLPTVNAGPALLATAVDINLTLPPGIVGKVELAPDASQDYLLFQDNNVVSAQVLAGTTAGSVKLRLMRRQAVYHWDRDVDIRFTLPIAADVGYPPQGWWPAVIVRVPVSWNGGDAFRPDTDCHAKVVVDSWSVSDTYSGALHWLHRLELRVTDYAPPYDAFNCLWGYLRVTWPDGTRQVLQIMCLSMNIDAPRVFTLKSGSDARPTVSVELELYYNGVNRRRQANGTDFDYLPVPGPALIRQTLTP